MSSEITFKSFEFRDSIDILGNQIIVGVLKFDFVDGDGNIGFLEDEVLYDDQGKEFNHNCFLTLFHILFQEKILFLLLELFSFRLRMIEN